MAQPDVFSAGPIDFPLQLDSFSRPTDDNNIFLTPISPGHDNGSDYWVHVKGLPPLLRGHPDVHLRERIIRAFANDAADSEKAFFAADLSQVYAQHARWLKSLPDIEPFFGKLDKARSVPAGELIALLC